MRKLGLFIIILTLTFGTFAQKKVTPLPLDSLSLPSRNSFIYFLPKTSFKIDVTVSVIQKEKGFYSDFSEKLLGISNIVRENKTVYKISKIEIKESVVSDPNYQYLVDMSPKQIKEGFYSTLFNKNNGSQIVNTPLLDQTQSESSKSFTQFASIQYQEKEENYVDTRIIEGVVTQVPISKTKTITKSLEQEAQEVAELIIKIRKDRYALISETHEAPISKEAMEFIITEMDQLEKNYLELFIGHSIIEENRYSFIITPESNNILQIPVFAFTETDGITATHIANPKNIYALDIEPQLNLDLYTEQMQLWESNKKWKSNTGYRIRQAMPARVSISKANIPIHFFGIFPIFQLSNIQILPLHIEHFDITKYGFIH